VTRTVSAKLRPFAKQGLEEHLIYAEKAEIKKVVIWCAAIAYKTIPLVKIVLIAPLRIVLCSSYFPRFPIVSSHRNSRRLGGKLVEDGPISSRTS
jgi:hypothetical protein